MRCRAAWRAAVLAVIVAICVGCVWAQGPEDQGGPGPGNFAGMQRVAGEVTAVEGARLTVRTEDGSSMQIVTTTNTRVMKDRGVTIKVSDLKTGDGIMAAGNLDAANKTLHAAIVFATDAAQLKELRENLGKTYIMGRVKAIDMDDAKMTVERPDGVSQTIGFDDTTSFRRGKRRGGGLDVATTGVLPQSTERGIALPETGESITLADVKVGDAVRGKGSLKRGVFVPTEIVVMTPRGTARHPGQATGGGAK